MAVIAQADPYQSLIRKIGYSVGLENIVERVSKLVTLYEREGGISAQAFRGLIERDFGRKNAVEHFANFYSTLNLVRALVWEQSGGVASQPKKSVLPKILEPMYQLDSLSILKRLLPDNEKFELASKVVLTQAIIEADGDIFLNALLSDFKHDPLKTRLESMINKKRELLRNVMRTPGLLSKINQIVNIKNESNRSSQPMSEKTDGGRFSRRTAPLDLAKRTEALEPSADEAVSVPADYLKKVSNSRHGWATDLGLFEGENISDRGSRLLAVLERRGNTGAIKEIDGLQTAVFWGYQSELKRMRIDPQKIDASTWEAWDLLGAIADAFSIGERKVRKRDLSEEDVLKFLRRVFELYKVGSASKAMIRNSLPLYVAEPVLAAWCVAENIAIPSLQDILQSEFNKKGARRVQKMIIRGTAGALFFTKVA